MDSYENKTIPFPLGIREISCQVNWAAAEERRSGKWEREKEFIDNSRRQSLNSSGTWSYVVILGRETWWGAAVQDRSLTVSKGCPGSILHPAQWPWGQHWKFNIESLVIMFQNTGKTAKSISWKLWTMRIKVGNIIDSATLPYFEVLSSWHGYVIHFFPLEPFLHFSMHFGYF